jgi:hypothetical protein
MVLVTEGDSSKSHGGSHGVTAVPHTYTVVAGGTVLPSHWQPMSGAAPSPERWPRRPMGPPGDGRAGGHGAAASHSGGIEGIE